MQPSDVQQRKRVNNKHLCVKHICDTFFLHFIFYLYLFIYQYFRITAHSIHFFLSITRK